MQKRNKDEACPPSGCESKSRDTGANLSFEDKIRLVRNKNRQKKPGRKNATWPKCTGEKPNEMGRLPRSSHIINAKLIGMAGPLRSGTERSSRCNAR